MVIPYAAVKGCGKERGVSQDALWLDAEQQAHWRAFLSGSWALLTALERDLEESTGLSMSEYEVLVRLSEAEGRSLRMSQLADQVVASRSRLTHTVQRMEQAGLVARRASLGDRRGVDCVLTDAGFARLVEAAPHHVASVRARLVDVLPPEQFARLGEIFAVLGAALDQPDPVS